MSTRPKLMIPGPVDIPQETLDALSEQVLPYYGSDWEPVYHETLTLLAQVFQTQNDLFILTAPGTGAIETGIASMFAPGDEVAVISNGHFANRAIALLQTYRCEAVEVQAEWGKAVDPDDLRRVLQQQPDLAGVVVVANETSTGVRNPVREYAQIAHMHDLPILVDAVSAMGGYNLPVDEWKLDLVCTSSNKALELPPGLGMVSVSERAWAQIDAKEATSQRGWYYNLSTWKPYRDVRPGARVSPATLATNLIVALRTSLKSILEEETLAGHWARYAWAQQTVRTALATLGFGLLVAEADASPTVTAYTKRDDMASEQELRKFMAEEHGYMLAGAPWGVLAGTVGRIGHMGLSSTPDYVYPCLLGIEDFVRRVKGIDLPVGSALAGLPTNRPQ